MTNKPQSENKTIDEILDELADKLGYKNDLTSRAIAVFEFKAGFKAAIALSEKRAAGLVDFVIKITKQTTTKEYLEEEGEEIDGVICEAWDFLILDARKALSKYRSEG